MLTIIFIYKQRHPSSKIMNIFVTFDDRTPNKFIFYPNLYKHIIFSMTSHD